MTVECPRIRRTDVDRPMCDRCAMWDPVSCRVPCDIGGPLSLPRFLLHLGLHHFRRDSVCHVIRLAVCAEVAAICTPGRPHNSQEMSFWKLR
jgi:hypothetical protein